MIKYDPETHERAIEAIPVYQDSSLAERLDKTKGIVRRVKLLGAGVTRNRRQFTRECQENLKDRIEKCVVYLDHAEGSNDPSNFKKPQHSVTTKFARLSNAAVDETGSYADLRYNKGHYFTPAFEWYVENDPEALGLSIDGILKGPFLSDGTRSVESVLKLYSFDLVGDPSSNRSLFEEYQENSDDEATEPMEGEHTQLSLAGEDPIEKLCDFIRAVMTDKSISFEERKSKARKAIELMYEDDSELEEPEGDEPVSTEAKTESGKESVALTDAERIEFARLRAENDAFRATEALNTDTVDARTLCDKAGLPKQLITDVFVTSLVTRGRESWEEMIADRKLLMPKPGGETPTSTERGTGAAKSLKERVDELLKSSKGTI